jgi:23S rRNA pseudouridine2605 synthase
LIADAPAPAEVADAGSAEPPARDRGADPDAARSDRATAATPAKEAGASSDFVHAEPVPEGAPSPVTPIAEAVAEVTAQGQGGVGEDATPPERSRRRNRRDRGRNRGEALVVTTEASAAGEGAEEDDTVEAEVIEPLPPTDPNEVFAHVVSGEFDAEDGETSSAPAVPPKRVLRAEPDAPKLQKVLAQAGIGSRRDMEQLIVDGKVTVNGQAAHIGQRISFGDHIKVDGRPVKVRIVPPAPRVIAYHKPVGEVVTHDDPQHRPTVFRRLPRLAQGKWQSVGRLDINTEGLLLFTNSGELANQLMHPRFGVEREYAVRVLGTLDDEARAELLEGVSIDGQTASFKSIEDGGGEGANHWYRVVIAEGRNREVRKLFDAVGLTVSRLIRIRYGSLVLPRGLKRGVWVDLGDDDVRAIRRLVGAGEGQSREERGGRRNKKRNRHENQRNEHRPGPRGNRPADMQNGPRPETSRGREDVDADFDEEIDPARIPNPLEQTFDKRFVQNPRSAVGGRGFRSGGGGFGTPGSGSNSGSRKGGGGPKEPDPLQTSVGYIGADAFHRKGNRGGRGGKGGGFGGGRGGR